MRLPRRAPTVLDQRLRVAIRPSLASNAEAAGEYAYVRRGSMRLARLDRKVAPPDADHALRAPGPEIGDLAVTDHPGEGVGVVTGDVGRLREGQQLVVFIAERLLDLLDGPFQRASAALVAKDLAELLGFGAERCDTLPNGALFRDQETHTPRRDHLFGGCCAFVLVILCAVSSKVKAAQGSWDHETAPGRAVEVMVFMLVWA